MGPWVTVLLLKFSDSSNLSFQFCQRCLRKLIFFPFFCDSSSPTQLLAYILLCLRFLFSGLSFPISDPHSPAVKFMLLLLYLIDTLDCELCMNALLMVFISHVCIPPLLIGTLEYILGNIINPLEGRKMGIAAPFPGKKNEVRNGVYNLV